MANEPIASELHRLREALGMTLEEFGRHVGIPWQTLHAYEAGRAVPPADRLLHIVHMTRQSPKPFRVPQVARAVARALRSAAA